MIKNLINEIISELQVHKLNHPEHISSCNNLLLKYEKALVDIDTNMPIVEFISWNKLFAPRIIFDGIGNKKILSLVELLNNNLKS